MTTPVTVALLAGGKSSRMGTDKAFVRVLGRPLIEDILAQVEGSGTRMQSLLRDLGGDSPSQKALTPLVLKLFNK